MAEFGYPFDSQVTFESDGTPVFDRALLSADLRGLFHKLLTDGVILNPSNNLQVTAGEGMNVIVQAGFGIVQGAMRKFENPKTLAVQASDTTYDRIDTVVLRFNDDINYRNIDLYVLKGIPSQKPVRPNLTRTASIYELGLADLFISKNTSMIAEYKITDTRLETERCGEVSAIYEFDTTTLYNQIQADLENFNAQEKAEFDAWFATIKDTLSGDVAGNLQAQIGALPLLNTITKDDLVSAINEVNAKEVKVIDSLPEIMANELPNKSAGALAVKELNKKTNGKFAILTGNLPKHYNQAVSVNYPKGFTYDNCVVVSEMYSREATTGRKSYCSKTYSGGSVVETILYESNISVEYQTSNEAFCGKPFKIVLMKL